MTALFIIAGIFAFITVLLLFSITVYVQIKDEVQISIGAFGYKKHIDLNKEENNEEKKAKEKGKKKEQKKKPIKKKVDKAKEKVTDDKPSEKSFFETVDFALTLAKSIIPNTVKMLKHIRITSLRLEMTVAKENADETAITYGAVSTGIYNLLGLLDKGFKLKVKTIDITPDFVSATPYYDIYFKVKLRFIHILFGAFGIIFKLIVNTIKKSNKNKVEHIPQQNRVKEK